MCSSLFGSPPKDNSAAIAAKEERQRQSAIRKGEAVINRKFGKFDDNYYDQYQQDYLGNFTPQLQEQYDEARKQATLNLARTGNLTSSAGISQLGDLSKIFGDQQKMLQSQASQAASSLRGNVANAQQNLLQQNRSAADPAQAAALASQQIGQFQTPPSYSPLVNAFTSVLANTNNAIQSGQRRRDNTGSQLYLNGGGSSGYIV